MLKKIIEKGFQEAIDFTPTLYWDEESKMVNKNTNLNTVCFRLEDKEGNFLYNNFFGIERYIADLILGTVDFDLYRKSGTVRYCDETLDLLLSDGIHLEKIKDQILKAAGFELDNSTLDIVRVGDQDEIKVTFTGFPSDLLFRVSDQPVSISYLVYVRDILKKALELQEEQAHTLISFLENPTDELPRDVSMVAWRRLFAVAEQGYTAYGSIALNRDKVEGILPLSTPKDINYFVAINTGYREVFIPYSKVRGMPFSLLPFCTKKEGVGADNVEWWTALYFAGVYRVNSNTDIKITVDYANLESITITVMSSHLTLTNKVVYKRKVKHGSRKLNYQKAS